MPRERKSMKSICFFNNKGGVGKTTLVCNMGSFLASKFEKKALLLDLDPQCNSTQLVLGEDRCSSIFEDPTDAGYQTMLATVLPLLEGESEVHPDKVEPLPPTSNRFGVALLPGHPRIALVEDKLGADWSNITGGDVGAFRRTNWFDAVVSFHSPNYDLILVDVGPSLGALNRSVLIGSHYLLTPMGCDLFSLIGIGNIGEWVRGWFGRYHTGIQQLQKDFPDAHSKYHLLTSLDKRCRLLGYTVQQYITKSKGGVRRPTVAYEQIRSRIPSTIRKELANLIDERRSGDLDLGDIPHMYSLVPLGQSANAPIDKLGRADGLAGSQYQKQLEYLRVIESLCMRLLASKARGEVTDDSVAADAGN
jgi:cellulose biosynthesis protein BcsQ